MKNRRRDAKWLPVESSAVQAVRYDPVMRELDVRFDEGREYRYFDVPRSKYHTLLDADSIGEFVNHEIKPFHDCIEITPTRGWATFR